MSPDLNQKSFRRLLIRNISLPLILSAAASFVFIGMILYLISASHWVDHADQVIAAANQNLSLIIDAETGIRGYAITHDPDFLQPYDRAVTEIPNKLRALRHMVADNPAQVSRVDEISAAYARWTDVGLRLRGMIDQGTNYKHLIGIGKGKSITDDVRALINDMVLTEEHLRAERSRSAEAVIDWLLMGILLLGLGSGALIAFVGRRQLVQLSETYSEALRTQLDNNSRLRRQQWTKTAQAELAARLAGGKKLADVCATVLEYLTGYLDAQVGSFFINDAGILNRAAVLATLPDAVPERYRLGESLVGRAAQEKRPIRVTDLPADYLRIGSSLGETGPTEVVIVPIQCDGNIEGVMELGFQRPPPGELDELLEQVGESLGLAMRSARYREQLEQLLSEVQNQAEELQSQQEELRVSNEELEEQTQILEHQRDELNRIRDDLEENAEELRRSSQYKSEFLANMSHELRTPLNSSLILAKLLADNKEGNLSPQQVEFARQILTSGNDLLTLIDDILDLAKVEAGKLDVQPETFGLEGLRTTLLQLFEPLAKQKNLNLAIHLAADLPAEIHSDRSRLLQILKNLMSNAIKFTTQGGVSLDIGFDPSRGVVVFTVNDSGIGIEADKIDVIFEAFRQADGTTRRKFGGTGLGLSISRDLASLLGGELSVRSQPGSGSTFTLTLPLAYAASGSVAPFRSASSQAAASAGPRPDRPELRDDERLLLIIEDDPTFAKVLSDLATEMKFVGVVAPDAEQGIEFALHENPAAILLDVKLPDHSGLMVLDRLKHDPRTRHIPIHVVSGYDFSRSALQMGAVGYALKPVKREELRKAFELLRGKIGGEDMQNILIVEEDPAQRQAICALLDVGRVKMTAVGRADEALRELRASAYDCMVMGLILPDMSGFDLLRHMAEEDGISHPPVIVYTSRDLTSDEEARLRRHSQSVIIKGARSPERLLEEATLFLHRVEAGLAPDRQRMLQALRHREEAFEHKTLLLVDDDMRNVFALSAVLEERGARVLLAKNGRDALDKMDREERIDLVLMDVMMPVMDGLTAIREIRLRPGHRNLPIIALTAKATKDDRAECLEAGANDYLSKPVDVEKLLSLIRVWLSHSEGRQA